MSEYIKREDVIKDLYSVGDFRISYNGMNMKVRDYLKHFAPAADVVEREKGKWISIKEKLPPERKNVLATVQDPFGGRQVICDVRYNHDLYCYNEAVKRDNPNGIWEYLADASGDYWNILDKLTVIAWMEYPEPYKEEV